MSRESTSSTGSQNSWEADDGGGVGGGINNPTGPPQEPSVLPRDEDDLVIEREDADSKADDQPNIETTTRSAEETNGAPKIGCWQRFLTGLRAMWSTRQTEDTKENRELLVKTTLRELSVFIFFVVILCLVTFGMTTVMTYYYTSAVTDLFIDEEFAPGYSFKTIRNAANWYQYMLGPLIDGLYVSVWNVTNMTANSAFILSDSKLLGVPRLRMLRVRNDSCLVHEDFRSWIKSCYGVYLVENEDTATFGLMNGSAWTYQTQDELNGSPHTGKVSTYGGGGYVQDLTRDEATSVGLVLTLRDNNWLERGTRAVFIDFSLYNANVNLFCVIRLLCEFPATGGVIPSWTIRTVKLLRYVTSFDYFILSCESIFILFIIYYVIEEILEIKRLRWAYFRSFFSFLDLSLICISILCAAFNICRTLTVQYDVEKSLNEDLDERKIFIDLNKASYWQLIFNYSLAVAVFMAWIKMFKFISFNKTMNQLSSTIGACVKDLIGFSIMFFLVFLAFAQLGYLIFGSQVEDYSNFESAIFSQFRILLGDFDLDVLESASPVLGPAYFVLFVFFIFFILLNMFLAIIIDTYSEVKAELSHQKNDFEMTDYFKRGYKKMLDKLNLRRHKSVTVQKSSTSDKRVAYQEWHKDLKSRGYAEAEIIAVCSKYDLDKGHVLTSAEVRKMQSDLDKKKFTLQRAAYVDKDSLDDSDTDSSVKSSLRRMSGGGVSHEEFSVLQRRVDRMEHSIGSIVSKIDAVLVKLENMEQGRAKRRETMTRLLDSIAESEGITDESKQHYMERLVRDELERWDSESCISGFDPSPASSSSGRGSGRGRQRPNPPQEYSSHASNA